MTRFNTLSENSNYSDFESEAIYDRHMQGLDIDNDEAIFISMTDKILKVNLKGEITVSIEVENHHGDIVYNNNRLYCAVNLNDNFNCDGVGDNWIYVYESTNLTLLETIKIKDEEFDEGVGAIAYNKNHFYVGGGRCGNDDSYIAIYDMNFNRIAKKPVAIKDKYGIQVLTVKNNVLYAGTVGGLYTFDLINHKFNHEPSTFLKIKCDVGIVVMEHFKLLGAGNDFSGHNYYSVKVIPN
jgi:hypothetical protein